MKEVVHIRILKNERNSYGISSNFSSNTYFIAVIDNRDKGTIKKGHLTQLLSYGAYPKMWR